jgi:hypothetical protein
MKPGATLLAMCILAAPVTAQDGAGTITGTLDLKPARWIAAGAGEEPTSGWTETDTGTEIRLVGTPEAQGDGGAGTLTIQMDVETGAIEARVSEVEVMLQRSNETWVSNSETIDLTLEAFQPSGNDVVVAGSFVTTVFADSVEGLATDSGKGLTIDGNFQATVPKATEP